MQSSIRVIKRKRGEEAINSKTPAAEKSVEQNTREMVSTVKSWITELQERKRAQVPSFSPLPVMATATLSRSA
jgi:hypothetical protein